MVELATFYVGEKLIRRGRAVSLNVVPICGWKREMWYDETRLVRRKPSPNLLTLNSRLTYVGTCLFEAVNVSKGRGESVEPYKAGVALLWAVHELHADKLLWNDAILDRPVAMPRLKSMLVTGKRRLKFLRRGVENWRRSGNVAPPI